MSQAYQLVADLEGDVALAQLRPAVGHREDVGQGRQLGGILRELNDRQRRDEKNGTGSKALYTLYTMGWYARWCECIRGSANRGNLALTWSTQLSFWLWNNVFVPDLRRGGMGTA